MQHVILYIPGLGDRYDRYRQVALRCWSMFGVGARLLPMHWYNGESYDQKYQRASQQIAMHANEASRLTLIGESAGGSMAINLFAAHPHIDRLITIAGVNSPTTPVASRTLRRAPAFAISRQLTDRSLASLTASRRHAIHTVSALRDGVVRVRHSQVAGAYNHRIYSIGHLATITLCLTFLSGYIVYLATRK